MRRLSHGIMNKSWLIYSIMPFREKNLKELSFYFASFNFVVNKELEFSIFPDRSTYAVESNKLIMMIREMHWCNKVKLLVEKYLVLF